MARRSFICLIIELFVVHSTASNVSISSPPINAIAQRIEPYTSAYGGSEIYLIQNIAQKMNVNVEWTSLHSARNSNIHVIVGGWSMASPLLAKLGYYPSTAYDDDTTVWCVSHAKTLPRWTNFFRIYKDGKIFVAIAILYYIIVLAVYALSYVERIPDDIYTIMLRALSTTCYLPPNFLVKKTSSRLAIIVLICASVLHYITVISFYCVVIKRTFQAPQIDGVGALIENKFQLAGDGDVQIAIGISSVFPPQMTASFTVCWDIDTCLAQLVDNDRLAVATSRKHAMNNHRIPSWQLHCFDDPHHFQGYPISIFIRNNYPRRKQINRLAQYAFEGGLYQKWLADSGANSGSKHEWERNDGLTPLTFQHIFLAWLFYGLYSVCSVLAFVAEHLVYYFNNRPGASSLWKLAEKAIDGKKNFWMPPADRIE